MIEVLSECISQRSEREAESTYLIVSFFIESDRELYKRLPKDLQPEVLAITMKELDSGDVKLPGMRMIGLRQSHTFSDLLTMLVDEDYGHLGEPKPDDKYIPEGITSVIQIIKETHLNNEKKT